MVVRNGIVDKVAMPLVDRFFAEERLFDGDSLQGFEPILIIMRGAVVVADERAVIPIGSFQEKFGVTLSLPSTVGRKGVIEVFEPDLSQEERAGLERSAAMLKAALERVSA